jgi:hypothetical protein
MMPNLNCKTRLFLFPALCALSLYPLKSLAQEKQADEPPSKINETNSKSKPQPLMQWHRREAREEGESAPFELRLFHSTQFYSVEIKGGIKTTSYSLLGGGLGGIYYLTKDLALSGFYQANLISSVGAVIFSGITAGLSYDIYGQAYQQTNKSFAEIFVSPRYLVRGFLGFGRRSFDFAAFLPAKSNVNVIQSQPRTDGDFWAPAAGFSVDYLISLRRRVGFEVLVQKSISTPEEFSFLLASFALSTGWLL